MPPEEQAVLLPYFRSPLCTFSHRRDISSASHRKTVLFSRDVQEDPLPALWLYGRTTLERNHGSLSECNLLLAHSTHVPASGIEK